MKKSKKKNKIKSLDYEISIDLHGFTVQEAHDKCLLKIDCYVRNGCNRIRVITGKSGIIRKEFEFWMEKLGYKIANLGVGDFIVIVG